MKNNLNRMKPRCSLTNLPVPWPFVILRLHCRGERQKINSGEKKWKRGGERARSWGAPFFCPLSLNIYPHTFDIFSFSLSFKPSPLSEILFLLYFLCFFSFTLMVVWVKPQDVTSTTELNLQKLGTILIFQTLHIAFHKSIFYIW